MSLSVVGGKVFFLYLCWVSMALNMLGEGKPNIGSRKRHCDGGTANPMSGYALAIDIVLEMLVNNTATNGYKYIYDGVHGYAEIHGLGACNGILSKEDCNTCMRICAKRTKAFCLFREIADYELYDCRVKYQPLPITEE